MGNWVDCIFSHRKNATPSQPATWWLMLINLLPDFFAVHNSTDRVAAYLRYFETHRRFLEAYWHNYVLDPAGPHFLEVVRSAALASRVDLRTMLERIDVVSLARNTEEQCRTLFESDTDVDVVLMVGVGAANAGELVVDGKGVAFVCLEHFTSVTNPETQGLGLDPELIPLWLAHVCGYGVCCEDDRWAYPLQDSRNQNNRLRYEAGKTISALKIVQVRSSTSHQVRLTFPHKWARVSRHDGRLTGPCNVAARNGCHLNREGPMSTDSKRTPVRTPVSTILTPLERSRVDAAAQGLCDPLHRESLDEVLADLRDQRANLVLISVMKYGSQNSGRVAAMVREFPRIPAVALLTETQNSTPHATLALGQLGIRTLVDARIPAGWQTLRNLLASQGSSDLQRSALAQISLDLPGVSKDCWRFFELLFDSSPRISTVRQLARHLNILPSTLMLGYLRFFASSARLNALRSAPSERRATLWAEFLRATDPIPETATNEDMQAYFGRIQIANQQFRTDHNPGWLSDRGMVFVSLGEPDQIVERNVSQAGISPTAQMGSTTRLQIWQYRQFNSQLVFFDETGRWKLTRPSETEFLSINSRRAR